MDLSAEGRQQSGQGKALRLPELFQQRIQILLVMLNLTGLNSRRASGSPTKRERRSVTNTPSAQNCARPSRSPSLTAFSRYRKAKYTAMRSSFSGSWGAKLGNSGACSHCFSSASQSGSRISRSCKHRQAAASQEPEPRHRFPQKSPKIPCRRRPAPPCFRCQIAVGPPR